MELLLILNPFEFNRTYKNAARILGISESSVKGRMARLKKRCPVIYEKFRKVVMKNKMEHKGVISIFEDVIPKEQFDVPKISFNSKNKCKCGIIIPDGQNSCYGCRRRKDRKKNPKLYEKDRMFPANGKTANMVGGCFITKTYKNATVDDLPTPTDLEDFEC